MTLIGPATSGGAGAFTCMGHPQPADLDSSINISWRICHGNGSNSRDKSDDFRERGI